MDYESVTDDSEGQIWTAQRICHTVSGQGGPA